MPANADSNRAPAAVRRSRFGPSASARRRESPAEGVVARHQRRCQTRTGGHCDCAPGYQAQVWSTREKKPVRRTFATLAEAKAWRDQAKTALRNGQLRAPSPTTLREASEIWLAEARAGTARTRSGDPYKPSAIRTYANALNKHLLPRLGHHRLSAITRTHIQELVDALIRSGAAPSTVRNAILPLRAIYRHAVNRDQILVNPTRNLELPAVRGRRDRIARPGEAHALINALAPQDRALWATALYAGLRRGELRALTWDDIDLDKNIIRVERTWDAVAGPVEPKSRSGIRNVPLSATLRRYLMEHRPKTPPDTGQTVFRSATGRPFDPATITNRARKAWNTAGLKPIGLHECRHAYASLMIAAGINPKALSTYIGHASITITFDRYGHLLPGNEHEAATILDTYLTQHS